MVNGTVYYYVVVSSRHATPSADSTEVSSIPSAGLPSPWKSKDIGPVADAGAASAGAGVFTVAGITPPQWLKVVRTGNTFRASHSPNGIVWTEFGVQNISMGSSVFIGLAVTSHDDGVLNAAVFDHVTPTQG